MNAGDTIELRPGFTKTVSKKGEGEQAGEDHLVTVNYHGTLDNGTVFDSTRGRKPFKFHLGTPIHAIAAFSVATLTLPRACFCAGGMEVIKGWDIGVATMRVGETSIFHIPYTHAYGDAAVGPIPPKSDLTFEIELLSSEDDRVAKLKWQLMGLVVFILIIVFISPVIQDHGHHGLFGGAYQYWRKSIGNSF